MAYKVSGSDTIKDDKTVIFENVTATVRRHPASSKPSIGTGTSFGYASGGYTSSGVYSDVIEKWSFSADANSTDVGDLLTEVSNGSGQSSPTSGYISGARYPAESDVIQKFPFSSDTNSTDVGDLTQSRRYGAGNQG
jgi:hypothetical protein